MCYRALPFLLLSFVTVGSHAQLRPAIANEYARVTAENDRTADQADARMTNVYFDIAGIGGVFPLTNEEFSIIAHNVPPFMSMERTRVLLDTDANNEVDDQHAIAYVLFSGDAFDVVGITVNRTRNGGDVEKHAEEAERIVKLATLEQRVKVFRGANGSFREISSHVRERSFDGAAAVNEIIRQAKMPSAQPLVLLPVGKLTNIALALMKDPSIASKVRVVWLGSNYPEPGEYNQENDEGALSYILDTNVPFEIALVRYGTPSGTAAVRVSREEIRAKMPGKGPRIQQSVTGRNGGQFTTFGDYSVDLFDHIDLDGNPPARALFDMAAVAIVKNPAWAHPVRIPAPQLLERKWVERPRNPRTIILWENFDRDAILKDFYQTMNQPVLAQHNSDGFERWAAAHALRLAADSTSDLIDLRQLAPVIGQARVVALGEPAHGAHEPLAFRNRLFRYLVEELGFTAIAIESALPESRRIQDFVAGGAGDARKLAQENLSWGFGAFRENDELILWMRAYNANPAHHRKIRFYGMDLRLGGPTGTTPTPAPIETALSYLARVDSASSRRLRSRLRPLIARLPGTPASSFSQSQLDAMTAAIDDLIALLERERPAFVAATTQADYQWALRTAISARQGDRLFRIDTPDLPGGGIAPAAWRAVNARDAAMAENVHWALAQEGPDGRMLVFAHNAHVQNALTVGGIWDVFERPANAMGMYLRSTLGNDLVIIGTSSAANARGLPRASEDASSLDAALARVGTPHFLLDLRASRDDQAVSSWLGKPHALRANFNTLLSLSPGTAFDALVFVDTLTPAHGASPR
jgi:erythromycin esterase